MSDNMSSDEKIVDIIDGEFVKATVTNGTKNNDYVKTVHIDIKKKDNFNNISHPDPEVRKDTVLSPTGDKKIDITVHTPTSEIKCDKYKSLLIRTVPYYVMAGDAPESYIIELWYKKLFEEDIPSYSSSIDCLDNIIDYYEHLELEYDNLKSKLDDEDCDNKLRYTIKKLEKSLYVWKLVSMISGMFVAGYVVMDVIFNIIK